MCVCLCLFACVSVSLCVCMRVCLNESSWCEPQSFPLTPPHMSDLYLPTNRHLSVFLTVCELPMAACRFTFVKIEMCVNGFKHFVNSLSRQLSTKEL